MSVNEAQFMKSIESAVLSTLSDYVRGRADEIVKKHVDQATLEINNAIRDEVSRAVLNVGRFVSVDHAGPELRIVIGDIRPDQKK